MAEPAPSESSPDTDREFEPTADMLVHDFDDEHTLEEEENLSNADSVGNELDNLEKEGDMPIEDLLAMYYGGQTGPPPAIEPHDTRSSSEEEILSNQDLTLDKDEIARDLLKNVDNNETSANELLDSVDMPSHTMRLLRSSSQPGSSDDDSEDIDYEPQQQADDDWKKSIQVGSDYQAVIPQGLCKYGDAPVEGYLKDVQTQTQQAAQGVTAIPQGPHVKDDEQALYLLLQCGHNVEEALRRRKMQSVPPTDPMSLWSEEECQNFENGLRQYGKDFYLIQQNKVKTRSVGELVQFYYLWKKTERHDVFANKTRLEKKKYALHPGVTDYMDRFLDEQENPPPPRDRAMSPNINSLLYGDPKRHLADYKDHPAPDLDAALDMVQKVVDTNALALSPLKLHPSDLHAMAVGATEGYNNNSSSVNAGAFAQVGFRPIVTLADHALCAAAPLISAAVTTCTATRPVGTTDTRTDSIETRHLTDIGLEPVSKRLKTDAEWTANNSSSASSSSSAAPSATPAGLVDGLSPSSAQQMKQIVNSDGVSLSSSAASSSTTAKAVSLSSASFDNSRINSTSPLNSMVLDRVLTKSPGSGSVNIGLTGDFSAVTNHDTSSSVNPLPSQHPAESAVQ